MSKIVYLSLVTKWKRAYQSFEMLQKDSLVSPSYNKESFPIVSYFNHEVQYTAQDHTGQLSKVRSLAPANITVTPLSNAGGEIEIYELRCSLPPIITGDLSKAKRIVNALEGAINRISKSLYVDGDYSVIDGLQMLFETEINDSVSAAIWRKNVCVVQHNVNSKGCLFVRLFSKNDDPLITFWKPENSIVL
ncbi:hypothetical protein [Neobacillus rhizophilus]|uniref:Uncharacterized protein n=1 Tax=Neobacillus rhizophilus TaxID=2833579 RepID=A0A942YU12_9BACI|nr:hypothetical protein [Neobacillus rhizophilus]MBS4212442.1 hypothetical protein [Neobacillus rhizophilus]